MHVLHVQCWHTSTNRIVGLALTHESWLPLQCVRMKKTTYSGTSLIWTPLGPCFSARIIEVSSFQGLLIWHGCGLALNPLCNVTHDLTVKRMEATNRD
jgi:hypothetical protein